MAEASESCAASHWASLRPGQLEGPLGALPQEAAAQAAWVSCLLPGRLPCQRVGPSASLLSLQTIGLGSPAGPDAAVSFVSSGLAGRPGPQLAEGMVGQLSL